MTDRKNRTTRLINNAHRRQRLNFVEVERIEPDEAAHSVPVVQLAERGRRCGEEIVVEEGARYIELGALNGAQTRPVREPGCWALVDRQHIVWRQVDNSCT